VRLVIWLAIGFVIYFMYGHRNAHATRLTGDDPTMELRLPEDLPEHAANR
jgi:hypothetical protein